MNLKRSRNINKTLALLLAFAVLLGTSMPPRALAAPVESVLEAGYYQIEPMITSMAEGVASWDGVTRTEPPMADGVYQISDPEHLAWFRDRVNSDLIVATSGGNGTQITNNSTSSTRNAILLNDIDLGGYEWAPIGTYTIGNYSATAPCGFAGTFDGNGNAIVGLSITTGANGSGLFGVLMGGTVKNLTVAGSIRAGQHSGGIVGYLNDWTAADVELKNSYNTGAIVASGTNGSNGAIVGEKRGSSGSVVNNNVFNTYYLEGTAASGIGLMAHAGDTTTVVTATELKSAEILEALGSMYVENPGKYPILSWQNPDSPDKTVDIPAIGLASPVTGAIAPTYIIQTVQYSGTVTWSPAIPSYGRYVPGTAYTATITLAARDGFTLEGLPADFFTVAGAVDVTNAANSGVITSVFPATASLGATTTVSASLCEDNAGFITARQEFAVSAGLAASYGYANASGVGPNDVTALDALVAALLPYEGDNITEALQVPYGMVTIYGTSNFMFMINGAIPASGSLWYMINEAVLSEGDLVEFFILTPGYGDYYTWFETGGARVNELLAGTDEAITLKLQSSSWGVASGVVKNAAVGLVEIYDGGGFLTGYFCDPLGYTDNNGNITISFTEPGTYILTAYDTTGLKPLMSTWLTVNVMYVVPELTGLAVTTPPSKTTYTEGENLNLQGLVLTVSYSNGTSSVITSGYTTDPPVTAALTQADTVVTVFYQGQLASFNITVNAAPVETEQAKWARGFGELYESPGNIVVAGGNLIFSVGKMIYRVDKEDGAILASVEMIDGPGWANTQVVYADGFVYANIGGKYIQAFEAETLESIWVSDALGGTAASPVIYHDGYIYSGVAGTGGYVCLAAGSGAQQWSVPGSFYWAGSLVCGDYIIFGSDENTLYAVDLLTGLVSDSLELSGKVRSGISTASQGDGSSVLYFTTSDGYINRVEFDVTGGTFSNHISNQPFAGLQSTSTPAVYGGTVFYSLGATFGTPLSGSPGKLVAVDAETLAVIDSADIIDYPQGSPLVMADMVSGKLFIYVTYNNMPGGITLVEYDMTVGTLDAAEWYIPVSANQNYCTSSIVADSEGVLYYGNDSGNVFAVRSKPTGTPPADVPVNISVISGLTAPVYGGTPVTSVIPTEQFIGLVSWSPALTGGRFTAGTQYTATITLSARPGFTFEGVPANFFTVAGAVSVSNAAGSGVITVVFPATRTPVVTETITVRISIGTWVSSATYSFPAGTVTVYDVFMRAINANGLRQTGAENNYVTSINGLAEYDQGPGSGWTYTVNGIAPKVGLKDCIVGDGDVIVWSYTRDIPDFGSSDGDGDGDGDGSGGDNTGVTAITDMPDDKTPLAGFENWKNPFTDVKEDDWFFDGVRYMNAIGIIKGMTDTTFEPGTVLSRAMVVALLYRMAQMDAGAAAGAGIKPPVLTLPFSDVDDDAWYYDAVLWAAANGLVNGYGDGRFGPDDAITREQLATLLMRYAEWKGYDTSETGSLDAYSDAGLVSDWALDAMQWMTSVGLIKGCTEVTLVPLGMATRAEAAMLMMRFIMMRT